MHRIYDAMAFLLPFSLRESQETTADDRELIANKLDVLNNASQTLVAHFAHADAESRLTAQSLSELSDEIDVAFREDWPQYAYFHLVELIEHCVACHTRLPADSRVIFGEKMFARINLQQLDTTDKVSLYVATRRFDAALELLEHAMLDGENPAVEVLYRGQLQRYLQIALSTEPDGARINAFFHRFLMRTDVPWFLQTRIKLWQQKLTHYAPLFSGVPDLEQARALLANVSVNDTYPGDGNYAIEDLLAARLLRQCLRMSPEMAPQEAAAIYFDLARITLRTREPEPSVPELEMLLVAAIEAAPAGPWAKPAYAMLEEFGWVRAEHLAEARDGGALIDMQRLRELTGIDTEQDPAGEQR